MNNNRFKLIESPWLFLLIFIIATMLCQILVGLFLVIAFKLPLDAPITNFWVMLLGNLLLLVIVVPFVLGFPQRTHPYTTYLSEIRLFNLKPLLALIALGISCYLILALSQVAGVLIYRLTQGHQIDANFFRSAFILTNELPPRSMSWLYSVPSILEEIAFRGVILALFLRFYSQPKAIIFSALGFGVVHLGNLLSGGNAVWVAGQAIWSTIIGLFYGYVTLKTESLLPAMIVHYLGNFFVTALNAYIQTHASISEQVFYGITFTLGVVPVILMCLWVRVYSSWSPTDKSIA